MKVCWLQDLNPFTDLGGAQQTDKAHILYGLREGHEVEVLLPGINPYLTDWADLIIISNALSFPIQLIEEIPGKKPYIFFLHDYAFLCKYRLFYPMLEKCRTCVQKERMLPILQNSKVIIWLSPLHRESWLFVYPELEGHPFGLVPSPVSPSDFYDLKLERNGAIAVHSHVEFKGRERFFEWASEHSETSITLLGANPERDTLPSNVKAIPFVPPTQMNGLYNRHEMLVHLPTTPQPFERTVAEAYLAGCRVVGNKNIGALSWPFFHEGRDTVAHTLAGTSEQFWQVVERSLG